MIKTMTKKMNNKKGFTLIELIVVIAILGILAAIAIPRLSGFSTSAERRSVEADHRIVVSAAQMYRSANNTWPTDVNQLVAYFEGNAVPTDNKGHHAISGTKIQSYYGDAENFGAAAPTDKWEYEMGTN